MTEHTSQALAIASSAGGFKGVFAHGVLSALEEAGVQAAVYAAASSSVFPSISAAIGRANEIGLRYWRSSIETLKQPGKGMSEVVLQSIAESGPAFFDDIFQPGTPRLLLATSAVSPSEAAVQTQSDNARRLGRRLLLLAARGDSSWAAEHLRACLFDTAAAQAEHRLTRANIDAVIYASTRMLHAWSIPAEVAGKPYIDACYTCTCPAIELAQMGYREVIAIATEPGPLYRDIFQSTPIPSNWEGTPIHIIQPDIDPAQQGVDFTSMAEEGMVAVYEYGKEKGREFLMAFKQRKTDRERI